MPKRRDLAGPSQNTRIGVKMKVQKFSRIFDFLNKVQLPITIS